MTDISKMTDEELLYHFRMKYDMHTNGELSGDTKAVKAEILHRMEFKPCTECYFAIKKGMLHCANDQSKMYMNAVNETTSCKLWKRKEGE